MRKLELKENISVLGGDWVARYLKQAGKCLRNNFEGRACRRAERMYHRHIEQQ